MKSLTRVMPRSRSPSPTQSLIRWRAVIGSERLIVWPMRSPGSGSGYRPACRSTATRINAKRLIVQPGRRTSMPLTSIVSPVSRSVIATAVSIVVPAIARRDVGCAARPCRRAAPAPCGTDCRRRIERQRAARSASRLARQRVHAGEVRRPLDEAVPDEPVLAGCQRAAVTNVPGTKPLLKMLRSSNCALAGRRPEERRARSVAGGPQAFAREDAGAERRARRRGGGGAGVGVGAAAVRPSPSACVTAWACGVRSRSAPRNGGYPEMQSGEYRGDEQHGGESAERDRFKRRPA